MAGFPADRNALDARMADIAVQLRDKLRAAVDLKSKLDSRSVADLQALGYTEAEANVIKSAFTDLTALNSVATGGQTVPAVNNFHVLGGQAHRLAVM